MAVKRMPAALFVSELRACVERGDGYIMGAKGQDPKKLGSWYFNQYKDRTSYTAKQEAKALYWREHARFVWDCNGLAEGIYEKFSGVNINTKARYAYANWCGAKGRGAIPADRRVPGAAVYWGEKASSIHHVAYLDRPVKEGEPGGDWYLIEARGVLYGCVRTRMSERKPDFWGWMDKYFDYGAEAALVPGMMNSPAVKQLQLALISLGYDLGECGADGDFGADTGAAVRAFQSDRGLPVTGACDADTLAALDADLTAPAVVISGGDCWIRSAPGTHGQRLGVAKEGSSLPYAGETAPNGWLRTSKGWVSGKYAALREVKTDVG